MMIGSAALAAAVVLGVLTAPLAAEARQTAKVHRIGMLEVVPVASNAANLDAFRQGARPQRFRHSLLLRAARSFDR